MFAICIEGSHGRGMGHFYRALNLADELAQKGIPYIFYLNDHTPSQQILNKRGILHRVVDLQDFESNWEAALIRQDGITLWINDRLDTDLRHTEKIKENDIPLVTFDDYGTGVKLADLHVAALAFESNKVVLGGKTLCGIDYLILNQQIGKYKRLRKKINNILVTLGGSDTYGVTQKVVNLLKKMKLSATVVLGPAFIHEDSLNKIPTEKYLIKQNVPSLIKEFHQHDLAITGGGITPFEANASGLPCVVIANEKFEIPVGIALQNLGGSIFAGYHESLSSPLFNIDLPLEVMSNSGMNNISYHGVKKVAHAILSLIN